MTCRSCYKSKSVMEFWRFTRWTHDSSRHLFTLSCTVSNYPKACLKWLLIGRSEKSAQKCPKLVILKAINPDYLLSRKVELTESSYQSIWVSIDQQWFAHKPTKWKRNPSLFFALASLSKVSQSRTDRRSVKSDYDVTNGWIVPTVDWSSDCLA